MRLLLVIVAVCFSTPVWACLEKPKALSFSGTTFEKDVEIGLGLNCRVSLRFKVTSGMQYMLMANNEKKELCLDVVKDADYKNSKKYCGQELSDLKKSNKEVLTLRNKDGVAVGFINVEGPSVQIQSWDKGGTTKKPYIDLVMEDAESKWIFKAMEKADTQVGGGNFESTACTRGIDRPGANTVDIRGKKISPAGAGCQSGLDVADYSSDSVGIKKNKPKSVQ